jgi:membrane glycosyltransferase
VARAREALVGRALAAGPAALGPAERTLLLGDPVALARLHVGVWSDASTSSPWTEVRNRPRPPLPHAWRPAESFVVEDARSAA